MVILEPEVLEMVKQVPLAAGRAPVFISDARRKGFIRGSQELADYRPLGIFIGWEVPGIFDVDLQIRNLSLKALPKP